MAGQKRESLMDVDTEEFYLGLQQAVAGLRITSFGALQRRASNAAIRMRQLCPVATGALRSRIGFAGGTDEEGRQYVEVGVMRENQTALPRRTQVAQMQRVVAAAMGVQISAFALAHGLTLPHRASQAEGTDPSEYAWYVEFGTVKMRAQPFVRPGLAEEMGVQVPAIGAGGRMPHSGAHPFASKLSRERQAQHFYAAAAHELRF